MYKVMFAKIGVVPMEIRGELRLRLDEVAKSLADVPPDHGVWESVRDDEVQIDVRGWQFFYRVERDAQLLTVVRAVPAAG
ncbi:MAG TPA: hypothetical protein VEP66_14840 [Myxococcales bacterium]|nr:hypothetical protein [Myxococcales bacterium]